MTHGRVSPDRQKKKLKTKAKSLIPLETDQNDCLLLRRGEGLNAENEKSDSHPNFPQPIHANKSSPSFTLLLGDSLVRLKELPTNSVDSIVTDPPYGLSFMGKSWDYDVPKSDLWREVLRVLKPGGHLLAFFGTRTYHRGVVQIEDAGFEIRDQLMWLQGQGFPKNLDVKKSGIKQGIVCGCEEESKHQLRPMQDSDLQEAINSEDESGEVLLKEMQKQGSSKRGSKGDSEVWREEPMLARGELHRATKGLSDDQNAESPKSQKERLCSGAYLGDGEDSESTTGKGRGGSSSKPQQIGQSTREPEALLKPQRALDGSPFPRCPKCQKTILPEGVGSALKPSVEPIVLARKPLIGTVAENVTKFGVGGLNIDGSRIDTAGEKLQSSTTTIPKYRSVATFESKTISKPSEQSPQGRWPSNVLLDEVAAEMLGEPSRFYYVAKASKRERNAGLEGITKEKQGARPNSKDMSGKFPDHDHRPSGGNNHPTVKPIKLMQYLIKLITPPGGIVLDPFMGSGSTGVAAVKNGFQFIGCELSEEYLEIAKKRIEASL